MLLFKVKPNKRNSGRNNKNTPNFDLRTQLYRICGIELTQVDGLDAASIQVLITDIGTDMNKWKTSKHFCSWLRVAPNNKKSGGKSLHSSTQKTKNRANKTLRMAAQSLANANCALRAFYRRIRAKYGAPVASPCPPPDIINDFLDGHELFANATSFDINRFSPLMAIKISFEDTKNSLFKSKEDINSELKRLDKQLWEEKAANIYFRKKLNYKVSSDEYYIIPPNQRRFWTINPTSIDRY